MYCKNLTYTDYDGNERNEDFYFHLSKTELTEMNYSTPGGFKKTIEKIIKENDLGKQIQTFKEVLMKAYGEKSEDGRLFVKNKEVLDRFTQTEAFSDYFMMLATDDKEAAAFIKGIMPKDVREQAESGNNN